MRRPRQAENGAPPPSPLASSATDDPNLILARYTLDAATFAATTSTSKPKAPAAKPVTVRLTPTTTPVRETRKHNDSATTSSSALLPAGSDGELLVTVGCTYARPANTSEALAAAQSALATTEAATVAVSSSGAAPSGASTPRVDPATTATTRPKAAGAVAQAPPLQPFPNQSRAPVAVPPVFDLPPTAASPHAVDEDIASVGAAIERKSPTKNDQEPSLPPRDASAVTPMAEAPSSPHHHATKESVSSTQDPPLSSEEAPSSPSNGNSNNVTPGRRLPAPSYADLSQVEQYRALTLLYNEANKAMSGSTEMWSSPKVGPAAASEPTVSSSSTSSSHVSSPPGLIRRSGTAGMADDNNDDSDDGDDYSASFRERAANDSYDSGLAALLVEVDSLVRSPDRHSAASLNSSRNSHLSPKHGRCDGFTQGGAGGGSSEEAPDGVEAIMAEEARILEALSVDLEGMVVAARHGRHSNGSWSGGKSELGTPPPLHRHGSADGGSGAGGNRGHLDFDDTFDSELSPLFLGAQWGEGVGDAKKLRSWLVRDVLPAHPTAARAFAAAAASTGAAVGALGSSFPQSAPLENPDSGSSLFEATVDAILNENGGDGGGEINENFVLDAGGSIVEEFEPFGEAEPLGLDGVSTNALGRALGVTFELARRGDQVKTLALSQAAWDQSEDEEDYDEEEDFEENEDDTDSDEDDEGDKEGDREVDSDNEGASGGKEEELTSSGGRTDTGSPRSPERFPHAPEVDPAVPSNVNAGRCGAALSSLEALVELSFADAPSLEGTLSELLGPLCRRHRRIPRRHFTLDDVNNADCAAESSYYYEEGSDAYEGLRVLLLERCSALTGPLTAAALVGKQDDDDDASFEGDEDVGVQQEEEWKEKVQEYIESMNGRLVDGKESDEKIAQEGSTNVPADGNGADSEVPQLLVKASEQIDASRKEKVVEANSRLTKAEAMAAAATASSCRAMFQELQEKNAKNKKNGANTAKSPVRNQTVQSDGDTTTNTSSDSFSISSSSSAFKEYSRSPPSKSSSSKKKASSPWKSPLSRQALAQAEKAALTRGHRTAARLLAALPRPSPSPSPASLLLSNLPQASVKRRNWSLLELRLRHCDNLSGGLEALAALPALRVLDLRHTPLGSGHAPAMGGNSRWSSGRDNSDRSDSRGSSRSRSSGDHLSACENNKNGNVKSNEGKNLCVAEVLGHSCPMLQELWLDNTLVDGPINALSNCSKLRILSAPHTNFFVAKENSTVDVEGVEKPQLNAGETQEGATNSLAATAETSNEPLSSEESGEAGCTLEVVDLGSTQVSGSLANLLCALGGGRRMCALKHLDLTHQESLGGSLAVFQRALSGPTVISTHSSSTNDLPQSALQCLGLRGTAVEGDLSDLFPNLSSSNGNGRREYGAPTSGSDNNSFSLDSTRDPSRNATCVHMLETIDVRGTAVTDAWGLAARLEDLAGCAVRLDHARTALTTPRNAGRPVLRVLTMEEESTGSGASLPLR